MRDILTLAAFVIALAVIFHLFVPTIGFSDIILASIFVVLLFILDILVKVVKSILGGSPPPENKKE